jgi:3-hydroxyacyl-CoA dehydrogenase
VVAILKIKNPAEKFAQLRAARIRRRSSCGRFRDLFHYAPITWPTSPTPRATSTRHPLGLRLEARPVRDLAGRRLEAGGAMDRRGHRRRQGDEQRAAAGLGLDGRDGVHAAEGSYSPSRTPSCRARRCRSMQRQRFPDALLGEKPAGETVFENDGVRLWLDGDGIGILSSRPR